MRHHPSSWASTGLRSFLLLAAGMLPVPAAGAAPEVTSGPAEPSQERQIARRLEVARAGAVRVALPAELSATDGLAVLGPAGAPVTWRLLALGGGEPTTARVVAVDPADGGWTILIDAGEPPPHHQGLRLPLAAPGAVQLKLEASRDGHRFRPLASAPLFRLGAAAELQGTAISYPAVNDRFLRLRWPAAELPRLRAVELEPVAPPLVRLPLAAEVCTLEATPSAARPAPRATVCELSAGSGQPVRGIELTLGGPGETGWRLRRAAAGRWQPVAEGLWHGVEGTAPRALALPVTAGEPLRLELWGRDRAPQVDGVALLAPPLAIELEAPIAGRYELHSGPRLPRPAAVPAAAGGATWVTAGPPRPLPPPPRPAPSLGGELPDLPFAGAWPVQSAAAAGELVRLELPQAVLATLRPGQADLRLARGARQVPFLLHTPEAPALLRSWPAEPAHHGDRGDQGTSSRLLGLPAEAGAGELLLRTPARPLARRVRLVREPAASAPALPPGAPPPSTPWTDWRCRPLPPLPCELTLPLPVGSGDRLRVELSDGDEAPLAAIAAELWRERRELRFVWPGAPVELLAGAELGAAAYDLPAAAAELLTQTASEARLGPARTPANGRAGLPRWALLASLALAALALLLVLARAVTTPGAPPQT